MSGGAHENYDVDGIPTDGIGGALTRRSMQARRSSEAHRRSGSFSFNSVGRRSGDNSREGLMHSYDVESGRLSGGAHPDRFGLGDLTAGSDSDDESATERTSFGVANGAANPPSLVNGNGNGHLKYEKVRPSKNGR